MFTGCVRHRYTRHLSKDLTAIETRPMVTSLSLRFTEQWDAALHRIRIWLHLLILYLLILCSGSTGCAATRLGYILENVAVDQERYESCDADTVKVNAIPTEEVMIHCGNWLGCIYFERLYREAVIYYKAGYPEILDHEVTHCRVGGPLHESDLNFSYKS